jgi:uncharacterized protein
MCKVRYRFTGAEINSENDWELPAQPYVPGRTPRPERGIVFEIAKRAPAVTDPECWERNEAYLAGLRLYAKGYFWEAHEVWEPVWMHARPNSVERHLIQALIQTANAGLKIAMGRHPAASRLALLARERFYDVAASSRRQVMGLEIEPACRLADAFVLAFEVEPRAVQTWDCPDYPALVHYNAEFFMVLERDRRNSPA